METPTEMVTRPKISPVDFFFSFLCHHRAADVVGDRQRLAQRGLGSTTANSSPP
jgi:hypothetical protein